MDFLLSLTPKAKKKLEDKTNKSVLYSYTLTEPDVGYHKASYNNPNLFNTANGEPRYNGLSR